MEGPETLAQRVSAEAMDFMESLERLGRENRGDEDRQGGREEERKSEANQNHEAGEDRRKKIAIRPVNVGSMVLRVAMQGMLAADEIQEELRRMENLQFGLSCKRGVERVAHFFRLKFGAGCPILTYDTKNAYNSLDRQTVMEGDGSPRGLRRVLMRYYGLSSLIIWLMNGDRLAFWGVEGVRQGCPLGAAAFCWSVHTVYERVMERCPGLQARAIMDDFNATTRTPPGNEEEWQEAYAELARFYRVMKEESARLGLEDRLDKMKLLIPVGAPLPPQGMFEAQALARGVVIAGCPIGSQEFVGTYMWEKVAKVVAAARAVGGCALKHRRVAANLLSSLSLQLHHALKVIPPPLIESQCRAFDDEMFNVLVGLCNSPGDVDVVDFPTEAHRERAMGIASLPRRRGYAGFGLTRGSQLSPVCFVSSLLSCVAADAEVRELWRGTPGQVSATGGLIARVREMTSLRSPMTYNGRALNPPEEMEEKEMGDHVLGILQENGKLKLQSKWTKALHMTNRSRIFDMITAEGGAVGDSPNDRDLSILSFVGAVHGDGYRVLNHRAQEGKVPSCEEWVNVARCRLLLPAAGNAALSTNEEGRYVCDHCVEA
jgi:hypothetical protein